MTDVIPSEERTSVPWKRNWPRQGLETLGKCPICNESVRRRLFSNLVDNTFFCAPGFWELWRCATCGSAYLDPRPTVDDIGLAYQNYYTHGVHGTRVGYDRLGVIQKLRRALVNGYTQKRYGSSDIPAISFGYYLALLVPFIKNTPDRNFRHLPPPKKKAMRLLDVGCGDGEFLSLASSCGWDVFGLDPDGRAIANASSKGIEALQAGIEYFDGKSEIFDFISLSHVIEHLHKPNYTIERCFDLLRPGGSLWIETPNINGPGARVFGKNWRGLEAPRHLVLFSLDALRQVLMHTGFSSVSVADRPSPLRGTFRASFAMSVGLSQYADVQVPKIVKLRAIASNISTILVPSRKEFLTVIAKKSGNPN